MSKLECRNLSFKYFGYDRFITNFSATFTKGINVIFGAKEAGKTTLLKAISGLNECEGELLLDGKELPKELKERDIQLVFDDYAFFSRHSVRYNLTYPLKIRGVNKKEIKNIVESTAEKFGISIMLDLPIYRLNEWQKVAITFARIAIRNAKIVLVDNVLSKLDLNTRKDAFKTFIPLLPKESIIIYATDSVEEAKALSENILLLSAGYLMQNGTFEDIKAKPATLGAFNAFNDFVTKLPCVVNDSSVSCFGTEISFDSERLIGDVYIGCECILAFLPTDTEISDSGIVGKVFANFKSGNKYIVALKVSEEKVFICSEKKLDVDSNVSFVIKNNIQLFDRCNERTILR